MDPKHTSNVQTPLSPYAWTPSLLRIHPSRGTRRRSASKRTVLRKSSQCHGLSITRITILPSATFPTTTFSHLGPRQQLEARRLAEEKRFELANSRKQKRLVESTPGVDVEHGAEEEEMVVFSRRSTCWWRNTFRKLRRRRTPAVAARTQRPPQPQEVEHAGRG
jgi:hypothetical protein